MKIRKIYLHSYLDKPLKGTVEFETEIGDKIEINLGDKEVKSVIEACAESLIRVSKDAADRLHEAIKKEIK